MGTPQTTELTEKMHREAIERTEEEGGSETDRGADGIDLINLLVAVHCNSTRNPVVVETATGQRQTNCFLQQTKATWNDERRHSLERN